MEAAQNPYQTPEGSLTVEGQGYGEVKFFSPESRVGRLRYLAHSFLFMLVSVIALSILLGLVAIVLSAAGLNGMASTGVIVLVSTGGYLAILGVYIIFMIQRLHDLNKSGWMSLLALVPLVNLFFGLYLIFAGGTPGANNYGLAPPPNKTWHWIVGLIGPIFMMIASIGFMAAVAIPAFDDYAKRAEQAAQEAQSTYEDSAYEDAPHYQYESETPAEGQSEYQYEDEASGTDAVE